MEGSPQKFGSKNPWSRLTSTSRGAHAFEFDSPLGSSLPPHASCPADVGPNAEIRSNAAEIEDDSDYQADLDRETDLDGEVWTNPLLDDDSDASQQSSFGLRSRPRGLRYDPRISGMFAAHKTALEQERTGKLIDVEPRTITSTVTPRTANEKKPSSAQSDYTFRSRNPSPSSAQLPMYPVDVTENGWLSLQSDVSDGHEDDMDSGSEDEEYFGMKDFIDDDLHKDATGGTLLRPTSTLPIASPHEAEDHVHILATDRKVARKSIDAEQLRKFPAPFTEDHRDLAKDSPLPFKYVDKLGVGASAVVDVVEATANGRMFAHKVFRPYSGRDKFFKATFKNEVDIIRKLNQHPHIIQVCWSYTRGRELGMLLSPVASDKDLAAYLLAIQDTGELPNAEQRRTLNHAFGCLANGLAYIHSHTIRHKDIKPHNILVHQGRMLFTDFGIALDASTEATTTTGMAETFTKRYCAPEVIKNLPRNRSSDVFSLGCVFLEIVGVLLPAIDLGSADPRPYCLRVNDIEASCALALKSAQHQAASVLLSICQAMICMESAARPLAQAIGDRLAVSCRRWELERYFCTTCAANIRFEI